MSITFPGKEILKLRVPGALAIGILVGQLFMMGTQSSTVPHCDLSVERPHNSGSIYKHRKIKAIKLNITSECNVPQRFTLIHADIQTINKDGQITAHDFGLVTANAAKANPKNAYFFNLYVECKSSETAVYLGQASGDVHFDNGVTVPVKGNSSKFLPEDCTLGAK